MNARAFYLALGVFCLDQAIVYWQSSFHSSQVILNTHSAWWVSVATLLACLILLSTSSNATSFYAVALMLAGGASNLLDRALHQGTVDYLFLGHLAFNVGDVAIIVGAALVLYSFRTYASVV